MSTPARRVSALESELRPIEDLEGLSVEELQRLRAHERFALRIGAILRPASYSAADQRPLTGETKDFSGGGTMLVLSRPPLVGDVYRIEFERGSYDLPPVYARCLRAKLVRDDCFEGAFGFLQTVDLSTVQPGTANDDLFA